MTKCFKKGDMVSGTKWNGEPFIGIYELRYDCGEHCVFDGNKYFSIHENDCHHASEEEKEIIRKTISKLPNKPTIGSGQKQTEQDELEELFTQE